MNKQLSTIFGNDMNLVSSANSLNDKNLVKINSLRIDEIFKSIFENGLNFIHSTFQQKNIPARIIIFTKPNNTSYKPLEV